MRSSTQSESANSRIASALDDYLLARENGIAIDRDEFLAAHCDIAEELDRCLQSLEFVQEASMSYDSPGCDTKSSGRRLGDFRLVREIGRGGMGVVYEAEQESLGRRVALKVLPYAAFLDSVRLQRFKQEAQAAAILRHPNIVHVHCVGIERGVHFYAMDLIEGRSLAAVICEARELSGLDKECQSTGSERHLHSKSPDEFGAECGREETKAVAELSTRYSADRKSYFRRIAELGIQIADALQYAHDQGIIHRDIKPSNLLIDAQGKAWITDFGLAQTQDEHGLTMTGDMLGTLRYMSPEQAEGKKLLDHRTDIYSLGVTLYESLTLRQAVDAPDRKQLLRQLEESQPLAPRSLDRQIPRDLETVLLKAMSAEPEDRYESADEFRLDMQRFLEDQPIQARRASHLHRVARWVRRNRVFAGLFSVIGLLVLGLAIGGPIYAVRYARLAAESSNASQRAEHALERERVARHAQVRFLSDTLIKTNRSLENVPGVEDLHEQLLEDTIVQYDRLLADHGDDPFVRYEVAHGYSELGHIYNHRFSSERTEAVFRKAIAILDELLVNDTGNVQYRATLSKSLLILASYHSHRTEDAQRAVDIAEQLVREVPNRQHRYLAAAAQTILGQQLRYRYELRGSERALRDAIETLQELTAEIPNELQYRGLLAYAQSHLGQTVRKSYRFLEAEELFSRARGNFSVFDGSRTTSRYQMARAENQLCLADLLYRQGRTSEAIAHFSEAVSHLEEIARGFPRSDWARALLRDARLGLAHCYVRLDQMEQVAPLVNAASKFDPEERGSFDSCSAADLLWCSGDVQAARKQFQFTLDHRNATVRAFVHACCPDEMFRNPAIALEEAKRSLAEFSNPARWQILGVAHYRCGDWRSAIDAINRARALRQCDDPIDEFYLAMSYERLGNKDAARKAYRRASSCRQSPCPQSHFHPHHLDAVQEEASNVLGLASKLKI